MTRVTTVSSVLVQEGTPANPGAILGTALLPLHGPRA